MPGPLSWIKRRNFRGLRLSLPVEADVNADNVGKKYQPRGKSYSDVTAGDAKALDGLSDGPLKSIKTYLKFRVHVQVPVLLGEALSFLPLPPGEGWGEGIKIIDES